MNNEGGREEGGREGGGRGKYNMDTRRDSTGDGGHLSAREGQHVA